MKFILDRIFDPLKQYKQKVEKVNALESRFSSLSDEELKNNTVELKNRLEKETLEDILPEAFAMVREAAKRTLKQKHYDEQLIGGIVLHNGSIAQMMTGEGKTLSSTSPIYLNALKGKGVHVVTVNEYLAKRDAIWMGQVYYLLGLTTACLVTDGKAYMYDPNYKIEEDEAEEKDKERDLLGNFKVEEDYLRPVSRREAYEADVTYGTNHEFGFDYLRDNLVSSKEQKAQRPYYMAIIDEVDSILIDEARTPLIISAPDTESSEWYKKFADIVKRLDDGDDYTVDEKFKSVAITDSGIEKVERSLSVGNLYSPQNLRLVHYLEESLKAKALFKLDKDYVVNNGEIIIVDEFTGRLMHGRRYSGGLHQAIEAKEGVMVKQESRTFAKISIQNYFKMYPKLAGMTGTATSSLEEFQQVYNLEVVEVPTHRKSQRVDKGDQVYKNFEAKMNAVVKKVKEANEKGQPVLIGTTSIEKNEIISKYLNKEGIKHEVLNAKNHEQEGQIIAQAGREGAVVVATNMAGRGVDIILGGNPPDKSQAKKVREAGGLLVIGTERHEARRIDDQLRGRSGRQGDMGESQFFLSLDDDLLRVFGAERIQGLLKRFDFPDDMPIEMGVINRAVKEAQKKIEGFHFDSRRHLLRYDDVLNKQRTAAYSFRDEILALSKKEDVVSRLEEDLEIHVKTLIATVPYEGIDKERAKEMSAFLVASSLISGNEADTLEKIVSEEKAQERLEIFLKEKIEKRVKDIAEDNNIKSRMIAVFDMLWMNHLEDVEALVESVKLRAYGQKDPLVEYRREGKMLFDKLFDNFRGWLFENIFRLSKSSSDSSENNEGVPQHQHISSSTTSNDEKFKGVGRNDECPCGSGKKFKKCHGK